MSERQFLLRSIGTQDIELNTVVDAATAHVLIRNTEAIFRLVYHEAVRRDDGTFAVTVRLVPDNGIVAIIEEHSPDNPISGS